MSNVSRSPADHVTFIVSWPPCLARDGSPGLFTRRRRFFRHSNSLSARRPTSGVYAEQFTGQQSGTQWRIQDFVEGEGQNLSFFPFIPFFRVSLPSLEDPDTPIGGQLSQPFPYSTFHFPFLPSPSLPLPPATLKSRPLKYR